METCLSSPELLGSKGELIVYSSMLRRPSIVHHFQRSSPKPLGQSKPNFMWSHHWKGKKCLYKWVTTPIYGKTECFDDYRYPHLSRVIRKPAFCLCDNKDADQLRGNREADQRLCFRYTDSTISLLPKSEI